MGYMNPQGGKSKKEKWENYKKWKKIGDCEPRAKYFEPGYATGIEASDLKTRSDFFSFHRILIIPALTQKFFRFLYVLTVNNKN